MVAIVLDFPIEHYKVGHDKNWVLSRDISSSILMLCLIANCLYFDGLIKKSSPYLQIYSCLLLTLFP